MDSSETTMLKAACIQAAATLLASQAATGVAPAAQSLYGRNTPDPDTAACARFARDLYGKVTGETWD